MEAGGGVSCVKKKIAHRQISKNLKMFEKICFSQKFTISLYLPEKPRNRVHGLIWLRSCNFLGYF